MARYIYTILFYIALPFILLRLLWKSRKNRDYREKVYERFGIFKKTLPQNCIWLHAVSLGESIAATPLIKNIHKNYPDIPIVVTTTTPTGAKLIEKNFGNEVTHCFSPYDIPDVLERFLNKIKPRLLIIMETELWPNLFYSCKTRHIPIFIANARLSERSARGYQKISALSKQLLQAVTKIAVQTQIEAERFIQLGLDPNKAQVTGSIKFDLEIPAKLREKAKDLRQQWGETRFVWVAASTHEGEETQILAAFKKLKLQLPQLLLVLVPRHQERFARVIQLCKNHSENIVLRSENRACTADTEIFIGDSMGELLLFYAAADVAFVGGSLIAVGGHNPLEPAALNLPILMGPHYFNFADICSRLSSTSALKIVNNEEELHQQLFSIASNDNLRHEMGNKAYEFVLQNKGATEKHLQMIGTLL